MKILTILFSAHSRGLLQKTVIFTFLPDIWNRPLSSASILNYPLAPGWGSKQSERKSKKKFSIPYIMDAKCEEILAPLRAAVKEQVSILELSPMLIV